MFNTFNIVLNASGITFNIMCIDLKSFYIILNRFCIILTYVQYILYHFLPLQVQYSTVPTYTGH